MTSLKADFFKPFVDGTLNTFKVVCSVDAVPQKPFIKGTAPQPDFGIAGVLSLASPSFTGTITVCFPEPLFLKLMGNMLGEEFPAITDELQDGAAEFLNMIFGHAKTVLNQQGHQFQRAIPTVIRGKGLKSSHPGNGVVMVIPFKTEFGELHVEICSEAG